VAHLGTYALLALETAQPSEQTSVEDTRGDELFKLATADNSSPNCRAPINRFLRSFVFFIHCF